MNRKIKQIVSGLLVMCMMCIMLPGASIVSLAAGNARISFSDPTVTVGEEVSGTMKFASKDGTILGDTKTYLNYDATVLEYVDAAGIVSGGAGTLVVRSVPEGHTEAITVLRFKALQAGTSTITIADWEGYDNDGGMLKMERQGTSNVTVNPLATSSTDASLKNMQISPGTLSPAFTPTVENYRVDVGLDTNELSVSAVSNNNGATVGIEGNTGLQEGENTVICRITAEDGVTTKEYTIIVNKFVGGETTAAEGEDETTASAEEPLATLKIYAQELYILPLSDELEIPEGFRESTIAIGDIQVKGFVWAAEPESPRYCVFYAMNANGDKGLYRFDLVEKTIQRYFEDPALPTKITEEQYKELADVYASLLKDFRIRLYIIIALGAAVTILLVLLIVAMKKKGKQTGRDYQHKEPEEELKTYIPVSEGASKEELYMLGEEEEYEKYEDVDMEDIGAVQAAVTLDGVEEALVSKLAEETELVKNSAFNDDDEDFEIFDL